MEQSEGRGRGGGGVDLLLLAALIGLLLVLYLSTYAIHGYLFPVGPDAPVYLWWTRLAGQEGLSAVGGRPGVPALGLVLEGTLGIGAVPVIAGLEIVLALCAAMGSAALIARFKGRMSWLLSGAFAGIFAVHLALGYVATLATAALFLGAMALLACGTRRAAVAAAVLLGAGGLSHPEFLLIGVAVLALAAVPSLVGRGDAPFLDTEAGHVLVAAGGGLVFAGGGLLALLGGAPQLRVDTSRDDFLQSAGMGGLLPAEFRQRLLEHAATYALLVSVPLGIVGGWSAEGFLGRLLRAWGVVLVAGVTVAFVTGVFPAERLVTFAFVLPIAAALGLVRILERLRRPERRAATRLARATLALGFAAALTVAFAWPAVGSWLRTPPKIWPLEVERVTEASRYVAASPPGTRLVFTASGREPIGSFFLTEAANAIRAAVPPGRIRDVRVVLPGAFGTPATRGQEGEALVDLYGRLAFEGMELPEQILWFDLAPFDRTHYAQPFPSPPGFEEEEGSLQPEIVSQGVAFIGAHPQRAEADQPLVPSSPREIALAAVAMLGVLGVTGYGWSRVAVGERFRALALAPVFGVGSLILGAVALERLIPIASVGGARLLTAGVALAGFAAWGWSEARGRRGGAIESPAERPS